MKKDLPLTALVRSFVTMAFLTSSSLGVMADNPRKSATNLQFYTYVSASESPMPVSTLSILPTPQCSPPLATA